MIVVAHISPVTALLHLKQLNFPGMLYGPVYIQVTMATELKTLTAFGYDILP